MSRQAVGKILVTPRGLWQNTETYEALDLVYDGNGLVYIAKKQSFDEQPGADTEYWTLYGSAIGPDASSILLDNNGKLSVAKATDEITAGVKLSNALTDSSSVNDGIAVTPKVIDYLYKSVGNIERATYQGFNLDLKGFDPESMVGTHSFGSMRVERMFTCDIGMFRILSLNNVDIDLQRSKETPLNPDAVTNFASGSVNFYDINPEFFRNIGPVINGPIVLFSTGPTADKGSRYEHTYITIGDYGHDIFDPAHNPDLRGDLCIKFNYKYYANSNNAPLTMSFDNINILTFNPDFPFYAKGNAIP